MLLIFSCCRNKKTPQPNILAGKIKKIESYTLNRDSFNHMYYFIYDSIEGLLERVMYNNKTLVTISKKESNYILLHYKTFDIDTSSTFQFYIKAYLDNDGYINKIVRIDSISNTETDLVQFYLKNGKPDSIREFPINLVTESFVSDFHFQENNMTQSIHTYNTFLGNSIDISSYFYNSNFNKNKIPAQYQNIGSYYLGIANPPTDPIYLLGLNGYFPFINNKNLVDSISINSNSLNYNRKYNYTFDNAGEVLKLFINGSANHFTLNFEFEYY